MLTEHCPRPLLALCPPPARLHHPLHQIRRHHQVRASLLLSPRRQCLLLRPPRPPPSPAPSGRRGAPSRYIRLYTNTHTHTHTHIHTHTPKKKPHAHRGIGAEGECIFPRTLLDKAWCRLTQGIPNSQRKRSVLSVVMVLTRTSLGGSTPTNLNGRRQLVVSKLGFRV